MNHIYRFPDKARFNKVLPKTKIYEHGSPNTRVKHLFVRDVEKITWSYKLSPETLNLPEKEGVREIQIFTVHLKNGAVHHDVLSAIDKAIPSPIIFIPTYENKIRYAAAYKRASDADKSKWVVGGYFETGWIPENIDKIDLPVVLNMASLYKKLLTDILPLSARKNETIDELINRLEELRIKERELIRMEARLLKEKQFNRKVALNTGVRKLKQEIQQLITGDKVCNHE